MSQTQVQTVFTTTMTKTTITDNAPRYLVIPNAIQANDPLLKAARAGDDKLVLEIMEGNEPFDLDVADEDGNTVLHHLILKHNISIVDQIFKKELLVDMNAPNAIDGSTPLHIAVKIREQLERSFLVELLLTNGAAESTRMEDHNGKLPLDFVPSDDEVTRKLITDFEKQATLKSKVDELEDPTSDDDDGDDEEEANDADEPADK